MKNKIYSVVLLVVLSLSLTGCIFESDAVVDDFEDCLDSEDCRDGDLIDALDALIEYSFRDEYNDVEIDDDLSLSTNISVNDNEYLITFNYEQVGPMYGFGSAPVTIDLLRIITELEEDLMEIDTEMIYTIKSNWHGVLDDMDLDMGFQKEQGSEAEFYLFVFDQTNTFDTPLSEIIAFLGTFELLMEYKETSVYMQFTTDVGTFMLNCEDDSFEYVLEYVPFSIIVDVESNFDVFKDIVNAEKRDAYTVITE